MFATHGARGSLRRALRAGRFAPVALVGVVTVGLCATSSTSGTDQPVLAGHGSSGVESILGSESSHLAPNTATPGSFRIDGTVGGLYPGLSTPLVLRVTNPQAFAIVVTSITTMVNNAGAVCPASYLSVSAFAGQLAVPAHGSATTPVLASLATSTPDACTGATCALVYSGAGRKQ